MISAASSPLDPDLVRKVYGNYNSARQPLWDVKEANIIFLNKERTNSSSKTVCHFSMPQGVDPVITYGPLKGVLDYTSSKERTSCSDLFAAVTRT